MPLIDNSKNTSARAVLILRAAILAVLWVGCGSAAYGSRVDDEIFSLMQSVEHGEPAFAVDEAVRATDTLGLFYAARSYSAAWSDIGQIDRVLDELASSFEEGLDPQDYHLDRLRGLRESVLADVDASDRARASFDILLSDGVLLYARHLQEGKVDPSLLEDSWNFDRRDFEPATTAERLGAAIQEGTVVERLNEMKPRAGFYELMKQKLAFYRQLSAGVEFKLVPDDVVLKPGMEHPNVAQLRDHVRTLGYLSGPLSDRPQYFDEDLRQGVEGIQDLFAIDVDGIAGGATFRSLNVSYAERVEQIRVNLDRVRWVSDQGTEHLVLVNIPGFELYYFRDHEVFWRTDVMVGTIRNETPIFHADISYLVLNPTWTVPRSIIRNSLFNKLKTNPDYIREKRYTFFNTEGEQVSAEDIDWSAYSGGRFPYRVVQQPGSDNAMGRVKFMFPNKYAVYLHDTPARALFTRSQRAFSHGCVRVSDPLQFAEVLLEEQQGWSRERIDQTLDQSSDVIPNQQVVRLDTPVPIMLMYWTVSPTRDGRLRFHPDVYQRDSAALQALRATPTWSD